MATHSTQRNRNSQSTEARVCGGFPVLVTGRWLPYESDTGYGGGFDDVEVMTLTGRPAPFIEAKMTRQDWDACREALETYG